MLLNRYPGIRPFNQEEERLFFGREDDVERLLRIINLEQIVILYGKSGYGKSSMLKAGIYPKLEQNDKFNWWEVRFGPFYEGKTSLVENVWDIVEAQGPQNRIGQDLFAKDKSIWHALKRQQTKQNKRFVLFFDQFEELFSYPVEQVNAFKQSLAEALYNTLPERYASLMEDENSNLNEEEEQHLYSPFELKVVFVIRSDRMSVLNYLKDYLPNLLQHSYQLRPLNEKQAALAIVNPAQYPKEQTFLTPAFGFEDDTLALIINSIKGKDDYIETLNLQIICKHIEENIIAKQFSHEPYHVIAPHEIGEINDIFENFYNNTLETLDETEKEAARHIIEDMLISQDGIRLPFAEQSLEAEPNITKELLTKLTQTSLLRIERDEEGRMIYEIGHDTLVAPILESAKRRREDARIRRYKEEVRIAKEKEREARKKQLRARTIAITSIILALMAIGAFLWALKQTQKASQQEQKTLEQKQIADQNANLANEKTLEAQKNLLIAQENYQRAELAYQEVQKQKNATEEERKKAEANLLLAKKALDDVKRSNLIIVETLLRESKEYIKELDYVEAENLLENAARLQVKEKEVGLAMFELVYFFAESNHINQALTLFKKYRNLTRKNGKMNLDVFDSRNKMRKILAESEPELFQSFEKRYYPSLVLVKGGKCMIGCDTILEPDFKLINKWRGVEDELPNFEAEISDFYYAKTETTFWQYYLYAYANGINIYKEQQLMPWRYQGDNPVVNVSWYEAGRYINWLNKQNGLDTIYTFSNPSTFVDTKTNWVFDTWDISINYENTNSYRLPTEFEYEYTAKGGEFHDNKIYAGSNDINEVGWHYANSKNKLQPVGLLPPNKVGLFDLTGNVWEWTSSWYDPYTPEPKLNPKGAALFTHKVARGGSMDDVERTCSVTSRYMNQPFRYQKWTGFRVAKPN